MIISLEELDDIVNFWKSRSYTIYFCYTSGGVHEGHIKLYNMVKSLCDRLVVSFVYYQSMLRADPLPPTLKYEQLFGGDCDRLNGVVRYIVCVPYTEEIGRFYQEHKERCKGNSILENLNNRLLKDLLIGVTTPLPFEKTLWKFDFRASSEKECLNTLIADKVTQEIYPSDETPPKIFFPIFRGNGVSFDTRDIFSTNLEFKKEISGVLKEVRLLIKEDLTQEEIFKRIFFDIDNMGIGEISFWSTKDVKKVNRPKECTPTSFLTSKGRYDCSILSIGYSAGGVSYKEDSLFDNSGRFVLYEDGV